MTSADMPRKPPALPALMSAKSAIHRMTKAAVSGGKIGEFHVMGGYSGGNSHNDNSSSDDSTSDDSLENTDSPNANQNNGSSSNGDSSNSNSSSGSGSSTNIGNSAQPKPSLPTTGTAKPVTPDTRGRVTVEHNTVLSAIEEARNAAKKNGTIANGFAVSIPVTPRKGQTSFQVTLKARTLDVLVNENVKQLEIDLDGISAQSMDTKLLKWLDDLSADGDIILRTKQVNRLTSAEAKRAIGNRPVYDLPAAHKTVAFADQGQISSTARTAVNATQQAGILPGKDGNRFNPQATATRAETATTLRRFIETVIDPQTAQGWVQNHNGKWNYYRNGVMVVNTTVDGYKIGPDGARK